MAIVRPVRSQQVATGFATAAASLLLMSVLGCAGGKAGPVQAPSLAKVLGRGWQCYASPTGFDAPGSIFTLGSRGDRRDEVDLSGSYTSTVTAPRAIGTLHQDGGFSIDFTVKLLENAVPGLTASATGDVSRKTTSTVSVESALEERSYDSDLPLAKGWIAANSHVLDGRRKAFVVRNALIVRRMKYDFDATFIAAIGGEAKYQELVQLSGQPAQDRPPGLTRYNLDFQLPQAEHLRVCILPQQLIVPTGAAGAGDVSVVDVHADLKIIPSN